MHMNINVAQEDKLCAKFEVLIKINQHEKIQCFKKSFVSINRRRNIITSS